MCMATLAVRMQPGNESAAQAESGASDPFGSSAASFIGLSDADELGNSAVDVCYLEGSSVGWQVMPALTRKSPWTAVGQKAKLRIEAAGPCKIDRIFTLHDQQEIAPGLAYDVSIGDLHAGDVCHVPVQVCVPAVAAPLVDMDMLRFSLLYLDAVKIEAKAIDSSLRLARPPASLRLSRQPTCSLPVLERERNRVAVSELLSRVAAVASAGYVAVATDWLREAESALRRAVSANDALGVRLVDAVAHARRQLDKAAAATASCRAQLQTLPTQAAGGSKREVPEAHRTAISVAHRKGHCALAAPRHPEPPPSLRQPLVRAHKAQPPLSALSVPAVPFAAATPPFPSIDFVPTSLVADALPSSSLPANSPPASSLPANSPLPAFSPPAPPADASSSLGSGATASPLSGAAESPPAVHAQRPRRPFQSAHKLSPGSSSNALEASLAAATSTVAATSSTAAAAVTTTATTVTSNTAAATTNPRSPTAAAVSAVTAAIGSAAAASSSTAPLVVPASPAAVATPIAHSLARAAVTQAQPRGAHVPPPFNPSTAAFPAAVRSTNTYASSSANAYTNADTSTNTIANSYASALAHLNVDPNSAAASRRGRVSGSLMRGRRRPQAPVLLPLHGSPLAPIHNAAAKTAVATSCASPSASSSSPSSSSPSPLPSSPSPSSSQSQPSAPHLSSKPPGAPALAATPSHALSPLSVSPTLPRAEATERRKEGALETWLCLLLRAPKRPIPLPDDLIMHIFTFLQPSALFHASLPLPTLVVDKRSAVRGHFTTISAALRAAQAGDVILIQPGTYRESLTIEVPVHLRGCRGACGDAAVVVTSSRTHTIQATTPFAQLTNLTLRQTGTSGRSCVLASHGSLEMAECDVSSSSGLCVEVTDGASPLIRRCRIHDGAAAGVWFRAASAGLLEASDVHSNGWSGVQISDGSNPTLLRNFIHENKSAGLISFNHGRGVARQNDITCNGKGGVQVRSHACPELVSNRIFGERSFGVWVYERGGGRFEDNDVVGNAWSGFQVEEQSHPVVLGNRVRDNRSAGIVVYNRGFGTFEWNDICRNGRCGVQIKSGSAPNFRHNRIHHEKQAGVLTAEDGTGLLEANDIFENHWSGVQTEGPSNPLLRCNRIHHNGGAGFIAYQSGCGLLEENNIYGNKKYGVQSKTGGNPTVRQNRIKDKLYGIYLTEGGGGVYEENRIEQAGGTGIYIASDCSPILVSNEVV